MLNSMQPWRMALERFVAELRVLYGERLQQVILYGSRARGDAEPEADIDTLVVLHPLTDFWQEFDHISPIANRISLEFDVVISALPVEAEEFQHRQSPLLINCRREGVAVG